jgi:glycerol uptake facilitator-like aquaporin
MALYEFLGMVIFLVGINCSQNHPGVVALGLFISATLTGRLSGGHFNLAITFAVYLVEGKWRQNLRVALAIALIDLIGAFTAMFISIGMLGSDKTFTLVPPKEAENRNFSYLMYLLIVEAFFTMIFVSTVLFVKYRTVSSTTDGMLSNLTVAIGLFVVINMAGPLSGGGVNPTIATAIIVTDAVSYSIDPNSSNKGYIVFLFSYIIGPLIGAVLANLLLRLTSNISNEDEVTAMQTTSGETYEIGGGNDGGKTLFPQASVTSINNGGGGHVQAESLDDDGDSMAFDERRNTNAYRNSLLKKGSAAMHRKETGLERRSARDYMA